MRRAVALVALLLAAGCTTAASSPAPAEPPAAPGLPSYPIEIQKIELLGRGGEFHDVLTGCVAPGKRALFVNWNSQDQRPVVFDDTRCP